MNEAIQVPWCASTSIPLITGIEVPPYGRSGRQKVDDEDNVDIFYNHGHA